MKFIVKIYSNNSKWIINQLKITKKFFYIINNSIQIDMWKNFTQVNLISISWCLNNINRQSKITVIRSAHIYKKSKETFSLISPYVVVFFNVKLINLISNSLSIVFLNMFITYLYKSLSVNVFSCSTKYINKNFVF